MYRRLVGQLSSDYVLSWLRLAATHFGDVTTVIVFATINQANTGHLDQRPETAQSWGELLAPAPDHLRRPITAYAAAAALGLPRETLRRKLNRLRADGYLEETPDGVILRAEAMTRDRMLQIALANTDLAREFCLNLQRAGVVSMERAATHGELQEPLHRAIGRATNTFCLRFLENLMALSGGDLMLGLVGCALEAANIRHLAASGVDLTGPIRTLPDSVRQPVPAIALARELGLPRETTRRHLHKLIQRGACSALPGGFIFTESRLDAKRIEAIVVRTAANARQLHASLLAAGVMLPGRPLSAVPGLAPRTT